MKEILEKYVELRKKLLVYDAERIMMITKWSFISLVSSMEYDAKTRIMSTEKTEFQSLRNGLNQGKKIYLSDIMKKSRDVKLLPHNHFNNFDAILYLRHCLIHNNGISDKERLYAPIKKTLKRFKKVK